MKSSTHPRNFSHTIEEMEAQENDLTKYSSYLSSLSIKTPQPEDMIFCGAGDSFACAIFSERMSNFRARAFDPYDLCLYPKTVSRKNVYFISVSGRTRANIQAAKLAIKAGAESTTAITANPKSELAKVCSNSIELKFTRSEGLNPGTNSFTTSLIACASLLGRLPKLNVRGLVKKASRWSKKASSTRGVYNVVGSGPFYPIALYGAAKMSEFAGCRANCQLTEEFSHIDLFSLKSQESTVILLPAGEDRKAHELFSLLLNSGIRAQIVPSVGENVLQRAIAYSIHLQYLALSAAIRRGFTRPAFLVNKDLLRISDEMIY